MGKSRLEAFSDGVIAVMVLELKVPHGASFAVLVPLWPVFMSYVLSVLYVGIYWNKLQYLGCPTIWLNLNAPRGHRSYASNKATIRD